MADFNTGELVRHAQLGVGRVDKVSTDSVTVAFRSGAANDCTADELVRLAPNGFWQAAYANNEDVLHKLDEAPAEIVVLVLRDMPGGEAHVDAIASELAEFVPNWDAWWEQAQGSLDKHTAIDSSRSHEGIYALANNASASVEDLYERFRTLPRLRSTVQGETTVNPAKIEVARSVMIALSRDKTARPEMSENLKNFTLDICRDDRVPVRDQVDLLLRGNDLGWLARDQFGSALRDLCSRPILIYDLGRFAQRRIVAAILEHVGFAKGRQSLLTAFAAERQLILEAREACLVHGQPTVLVDGLRTGLTENLLDEAMLRDHRDLGILRRWYKSFGARLEALSQVLDAVVFDAEVRPEPTELLRHLNELVGRLSRLAVREEPPTDMVDRLIGFWRRAMASTPPSEQEAYLSIPSSESMHVAIMVPMLRAVFRLDPSLHTADAFVKRIIGRDWPHLRLVLEHIVRGHWAWRSEVGALLYLCDRCTERDDALAWLADTTVAAIHDERSRLLEFQPVLDRLSQQEQTRKRVQGLRQEAFRQICHEIRQGKRPQSLPSGIDGAVLAGLADFIHELDTISQQELSAQRARTEKVREDLRRSQSRLQESEAALDELRRGYHQPEREQRFAERRRILETLTATVAEIERFATVRASRELEGVVRRLNTLFQGLGASAYGTIGETVAFDPARHELVGESEGLGAKVTVVERGYTIQGLDGKPQILKPARVEPAPGR